MTQKNSRQRVKVDTVGSNSLEEMYRAYEGETLEDFRKRCITIIERSTGKNETKNTFINLLNRATSKDIMVTKVTNYVMAGLGLGV
jgi:uncharacterized glyoxalase superfamily metalloenzyme YdcJ